MFFKKWKEQKKNGKAAGTNPSDNARNADPAVFPSFVQDKDGNFHLDFDASSGEPATPVQLPTLKRLYVISRDNIKLEDAQKIIAHAAMQGRNNIILLTKTVPLLWCSAYPDEIFGSVPLPSLLMGYIEQQEGKKYLKGSSHVMQIEGNFNGYDYYILALVE